MSDFEELRKIIQYSGQTGLSKTLQELEEKVASIYKLSGLTLDDIIQHLAKGDVFASSDFFERQQVDVIRMKNLVEEYEQNCRLAMIAINACESYAKTVKVEASNEFSERLNKKLNRIPQSHFSLLIVKATVEEVRKEMEAEHNESQNN